MLENHDNIINLTANVFIAKCSALRINNILSKVHQYLKILIALYHTKYNKFTAKLWGHMPEAWKCVAWTYQVAKKSLDTTKLAYTPHFCATQYIAYCFISFHNIWSSEHLWLLHKVACQSNEESCFYFIHDYCVQETFEILLMRFMPQKPTDFLFLLYTFSHFLIYLYLSHSMQKWTCGCYKEVLPIKLYLFAQAIIMFKLSYICQMYLINHYL